MNSIFRRIRVQLAKENNFKQYFRYAIGEILLVVIGILIALQINNWNEDRNRQNELLGIFKTISLDLQRDTLVAAGIIDFYTKNNENSLKVLNDEINMDNYNECPECLGLVSIYRSFSIQTKGFKQLESFAGQEGVQQDTLATQITQIYTPFIKALDDSNKFIKDEVLSNIETYKKYDWFVDWTQGNYNEEMLRYFAEGKEYKKQVASHNLMAGKNHLLFVTTFKANAVVLLEHINKRLENSGGS